MPALAASGYRVIALDPRGMGDSDHPQDGYDLKTVAADVHGFVAALGLAKDGRLDVVDHDVGTWLEQNRQRAQRPLSMPVLTIGGQYGVGDLL
ncbi:MAG TPA: alpha/beta fold hydrolase [Paraburkholderia sp.]|jgi:pimeloyl-ACP methyl ester carboxylesterase|nr:alpha/beta fold hydrolase [Paraburkholderia sp.]